jgi:hypothetical protein
MMAEEGCPMCGGTGRCPKCVGEGQIETEKGTKECECKKKGYTGTCGLCRGTGTINFKISKDTRKEVLKILKESIKKHPDKYDDFTKESYL